MENLETLAIIELRPIHYNDETLATVGLYRVKLSLYFSGIVSSYPFTKFWTWKNRI